MPCSIESFNYRNLYYSYLFFNFWIMSDTDPYSLWCFIAFIFEVISIIAGLNEKYSIKSKNLQKIGLHYNFWQGKYIEWKKQHWFRSLVLSTIAIIISIILSWVTVAYRVFYRVKRIYKKLNTPEKIKEIDYKLSNIELSKDEVQKTVQESANLLWKNISFDIVENDDDFDKNSLEFDNWIWFYDLTVIKEEKKYLLYWHTDDYWSSNKDIWQYKFEWFEVLIRLIQRQDDSIWSYYYQIKDWIILESEIIWHTKDDKFSSSDYTIEQLTKLIDWFTLYDYKIKYFLINIHRLDFDSLSRKQFFRKEIERIKLGLIKLWDLSKKHWIVWYDDEEWWYYKYDFKEEHSTEERMLFKEELEKFIETHSLKRSDIELHKEKVELAEKYLREVE